jgi:hypothetical protein
MRLIKYAREYGIYLPLMEFAYFTDDILIFPA